MDTHKYDSALDSWWTIKITLPKDVKVSNGHNQGCKEDNRVQRLLSGEVPHQRINTREVQDAHQVAYSMEIEAKEKSRKCGVPLSHLRLFYEIQA